MPYDRNKVIAGLQKACYKRPVSAEQIQDVADKVEESIFREFDKEVTSAFVGERVMQHLRKLDNVAYIRFASVYRDFRDAEELMEEISQLIGDRDSEGQATLFQ